MSLCPIETPHFKRKYIKTGKKLGPLSSFMRSASHLCRFITYTLQLAIKSTTSMSILSSPSTPAL